MIKKIRTLTYENFDPQGYKIGLYEKWKDKNKAQIQREGEDEDKVQ